MRIYIGANIDEVERIAEEKIGRKYTVKSYMVSLWYGWVWKS